jgi:hypothetical protein
VASPGEQEDEGDENDEDGVEADEEPLELGRGQGIRLIFE